MADPDACYRMLFSNPALMRDLLRGVVAAPWVQQLELNHLEPLPSELVSPRLDQRRADLVWKVTRKDHSNAYVVLLLEHQSISEPDMALRVAVYCGLLLQSLVRHKKARLGQLPQIVPLVVYSGYTPWSAALHLQGLCSPALAGCESVALHSGYFLLDEGALVRDGRVDALLSPSDDPNRANTHMNLAALLFKMEHNQGVEDLQHCIRALLAATQGPENAPVRQAFESWLNYVFMPRTLESASPPQFSSLKEFAQMLQEDPRSWARKWRLEGLQEGECQLLERQLTRKFGPLPEHVSERLRSASTNQLETWSLNVLDAQSLGEVFGE